MIPMSIFLAIWLLFLAIFVVLSIFSVLQMLRFGLNHKITKLTTALFVIISTLVILGTLIYLTQTDLSTGLYLNNLFGNSYTGLYDGFK